MSNVGDGKVLFERKGSIGIITLNRPETLNALDSEMTEQLIEHLRELEQDETANVAILTANGRGFCSGMDVADMTVDPAERKKSSVTWPRPHPDRQPVNIMRNLDIPVIGVINGVAAGAGMSLALGTDIRIASEEARFVPLFIKRGLQPDFGGSYTMTKILGTQKALELVWTGDAIAAEEAKNLGLVSQVVEPKRLMQTSIALAERLAEGPSVAIALAKRAVYRAESGTLEQDLEVSSFAQERLMRTEDFREGWKSFLDKRPPKFRGV